MADCWLAIENSTNVGSVAVVLSGEVLLERSFDSVRGQGSGLFTALQVALEAALALEVAPTNIVVGQGPGSYAGVRVAIAAADGVAFVQGMQVYGYASVAVMAVSEAEYQVIGDARRESFSYTRVRDGECLDGPRLLDAEGLDVLLTANQAMPVYAPVALPRFPSARLAVPSARLLAQTAIRLGQAKLASGVLEPLYLRDPHIT